MAACTAERPVPSPASSPRLGGSFRFSITRPKGLDPALSEDAYQWQLTEEIFDGLVDLDPDLNVIPGIARTWTVSRDGLVYTFSLRPEARFHNGRPVTAEDVAWSFRRAAGVSTGIAREYLRHIEGGGAALSRPGSSVAGIEVAGPHTLVIRLAHPYAPFLPTMAIPQLSVVPREEVEGRAAEFAHKPVGSGPFKVVEWRKDDVLVLAAYEEHYLGRPYLDRVEVHLGDFGADAVGRLLGGELDMAIIGREDRKRLPAGMPVVQRLELGTMCLGLNLRIPPWSDPRIRRAAALTLDREAMIEASGRIAVASRGVVPDGLPLGGPHGFAPERDLAKAGRLLAETGHAEGRGLPVVDFWANRNADWVRKTADVVARNLAEAGIRVRDRTLPWSEFLSFIDTRKAPAYMLTWVADTPDRDSYLGALFDTRGANNLLNYSDPEVDRLLEQARREMDPIARAGLYSQAEERIGEANVLIPLYSQANVVAVRPGLQGLTLDPFGMTDLRRLWWENPR